ncbi:MAG: hypothetical protein KC613_01630, partial [Myxococcales bacterium]|nr:hypothetical protein [Myxococcales bacterium]
PRQERRAAAPREPAPRFEPEPPPADDPEPPPPVEPDPPPAPVAKGGSGLDELFDDPGEAPGLGAVDAPPPAAAPPEPPADVAALLDDPVAEVPTAPPVIAAAPPVERKRPENADLGGGILEDDGDVVDKSAINKKVSVAGGSAPSAAGMGREEISDRLDGIKANLARTQVLSRGDVDFLAQIDQTHPGYHEANRLLADYYYKLKDYKRQTAALEVATKRGRYKHDPNVLLSLAKAYAQVKNFRKALSTMRRVEAKMRRLPADQKADAYRFHAEILEFEFQRQFNDDPKRANVTLVDKAISMWERYETFSRGANPGAVARAQGKIRELNELKSRVEL